jgi:hypothetical protein
MSLGKLVRRILGKNFPVVGNFYRSLFVDVNKVADFIAAQLPPGARCLDLGSGDGIIVNAVLKRRPDIHVIMTDLADTVGGSIETSLLQRVDIYTKTAAINCAGKGYLFDAVIITDVLHHIPVYERQSFWADLKTVCDDCQCRLIVIKDVEPGGLRGVLSLLSDRYVTGDRHVKLIASEAMMGELRELFGGGLIAIHRAEPDRSNYCVVARLSGARPALTLQSSP